MRNLLIPLITFSLLTLCHSRLSLENHLLLPSSRELGDDISMSCDSWRFCVETNNLRNWDIPPECAEFIKDYMFGVDQAKVAGDGKDAWAFDVDDTLLSLRDNIFGHNPSGYPLYSLTASRHVYNELQKMGFTIFLLTERNENMRQITEDNLHLRRYRNYKRLIMREPSDYDKPAIEYKSERRQKLVDEGYRIQGSSGDQWSDLLGYAVAERSFKLPNPMYYVP